MFAEYRISRRTTRGVSRRDALARRLGLGRHHSDSPWSVFSREPQPPLRIHNAPREHQIDGSRKVIRVFLEEWSLLREKDFKPLVNRHLRLIGLDLAEIWIGRHIEDKLVFENRFGVEPRLPKGVTLRIRRMVGIG